MIDVICGLSYMYDGIVALFLTANIMFALMFCSPVTWPL